MKKILFLFSIPFSLIYFIIISVRNICYSINIFKSHKINAKVISVGNITWGGTGKTPVAAFIADLLVKKGHRVSILIRGYGNDESELLPKLTSNVPVLIGKDRVKKGREAVNAHLADSIILDDGFQYRRLKRDLDIVCIDATGPFGNGWMIPAGSLREAKNGLKRADIFLLTKSDLVSGSGKLEKLEERLKSINPAAVIAKAIHRPLYFYKILSGEKVNIGELQNKELVLVSAIGSPECFEKTILRLGLKINKHFIFRDHRCYKRNDIARVEDYCGKNKLKTVITTEKDAVKLTREKKIASGTSCPRNDSCKAASVEYLALKVRLEIIENESGFYNRLFGIYNG